MKKYKSLVAQGHDLLRSMRQDLKDNELNAPNDRWLKQRNSETAARYLDKMDGNRTERAKELTEHYLGVTQAVNQARKGGGDKREAAFRLQEAQTYMPGKDLEKDVATFDRLMMDPDRKAHRGIFVDYLKHLTAGDPAAQVMVEQAIEKHRTPEERDLRRELQRVEVLREHHKAVDALMKEDFDGLINTGGKSEILDITKHWEEMEANATAQVADPVE